MDVVDMSRKRVSGDRDREDYDEIESEDNEEVPNEYEMERAAIIAHNQAYLQPCVDAANAL